MTTTNGRKTLVVILGPTGVGKTDLSLQIAKYLQTEIISCDSRQMYRELKIGTAVPEADQLAQVKHHFIGNLSIHDYFSSGEFELQAISLLEKLFKNNSYVVMTGGSGLYIDAVVKGIDDLPTVDQELRDSIKNRFKDKDIEYLQQELKRIDTDYYEKVDLKNPKRMLKAIEVFEITGKTYSSLRTESKKERPFKTLQIGLTMERAELYKRIDLRVDKMIDDGLVDEAKQFFAFKDLNSLNTVGYKELFGYFEGEYNLDEAIRLIKRNSRRYAKRQLTYWNRDKSIHWFHPNQKLEILETIRQA